MYKFSKRRQKAVLNAVNKEICRREAIIGEMDRLARGSQLCTQEERDAYLNAYSSLVDKELVLKQKVNTIAARHVKKFRKSKRVHTGCNVLRNNNKPYVIYIRKKQKRV